MSNFNFPADYYFPSALEFLRDPHNTHVQFKIIETFQAYMNPWMFNKPSALSYDDLSELSNIPYASIKRNVPIIAKRYPKYFAVQCKKFGGSVMYAMSYTYGMKANIFIAERLTESFDEHKLEKIKLLQQMRSLNQKEQILFADKYSTEYIKRNVAYIVEQQRLRQLNPQKYQHPHIYKSYIRLCFENDYGYSKLDKKEREIAIMKLDPRLNELLDNIVDAKSLNKKPAEIKNQKAA